MIQASICSCERGFVPIREKCPLCNKTTRTELIEVKGVILSHTTLHSTPEGFDPPIILALVQLEKGVRLLCRGNSELPINKEVKVENRGDLYFFS